MVTTTPAGFTNARQPSVIGDLQFEAVELARQHHCLLLPLPSIHQQRFFICSYTYSNASTKRSLGRRITIPQQHICSGCRLMLGSRKRLGAELKTKERHERKTTHATLLHPMNLYSTHYTLFHALSTVCSLQLLLYSGFIGPLRALAQII